MKKYTTLIILDGWGLGKKDKGNAIYKAHTPNMDRYLRDYPNTSLIASEEGVGLPEGQMGNSEVGHLNIGSGRIIYQELSRINKSIEDESFFKNEKFLKAINNCKKNNSKLHLIGLLSDGGVHSHIEHLYSLMLLAKKENFNNLYIHCFLDGRDVSPTGGIDYIKELERKIETMGVGKIASVSGRYYAMDRDNRWDRTYLSYRAMIMGKGKMSTSPVEVIENSYKENVTDEFILPTVIIRDGKPIATIDNDDSIVFYNFRPDRARQITKMIVDDNFKEIDREKTVSVFFVSMTEYDKTIEKVEVAFKAQEITNTFGECISDKEKTQLRIAETEKYAHVTFFFNGGLEEEYDGEKRILIDSPKVKTYDRKPEMSAKEITKAFIKETNINEYDAIIINFANPDMVGHTGDFNATIEALEVVDDCLGKIVNQTIKKKGTALITADHGNADQMLEIDGGIRTCHSLNKVPFILIGENKDIELRKDGVLADISPTMLDIMNIEKPIEMTGKSLII